MEGYGVGLIGSGGGWARLWGCEGGGSEKHFGLWRHWDTMVTYRDEKYRTCALRSKTHVRKHQMHVAAEYYELHRRVMSRTPGMGCDGGEQNEETTKADTPREFVQQTFALHSHIRAAMC